MFTTSHVICVMCHMSFVTCHMLPVKCIILIYFFSFLFQKIVWARPWRVCYQWGLSCLICICKWNNEKSSNSFVLVHNCIVKSSIYFPHEAAKSGSNGGVKRRFNLYNTLLSISALKNIYIYLKKPEDTESLDSSG